MSTSGHLKFQGTNRATFVGTTSNIMFDTTTTSLGIGVTGTDHPSSNLYITGNAYVSSNIEVGTANLFVDTTTSNVGIGTNAPLDTLHINGGTLIGGHILPTQHEQFDLGAADKKIRHLFLSDNSLWLGDETRVSFTAGKMKFRQRKKNVLPRGLVTIGANAGHNEAATLTGALSHANAHSGVSGVENMKLEHWLAYAKSLDATTEITEVFTDDAGEYEATSVSDAFKEVGDDIFSSHNVAIGKTTAPTSALDVVGTVTATSFSGGGSALTALNAANIGSGTLPVSRGGTGTTSSTGTGALVLQNAPAFTGDVTFDTNTLKIDASNNRVGIGTTTPYTPFEIYTNVGGNSGGGMRIHHVTGSPRLDFVRGGSYRSPNTSVFGASNYADWSIGTGGANFRITKQVTTENSGNEATVMQIQHNGPILSQLSTGWTGNNPNSGDGDNYTASSLYRDYSSWVSIFKSGWVDTASGWGTFWAGNSGAAYRRESGDNNPNEYVFVGDGNKRFTFELNNGQAYFDAGLTQNNYDYAEYFEWEDGNPDNEDRRGYSVVLGENGKIKKATSDDEPKDIFGIVSGTSSIVGDAACYDWHGKYEVDEWGSRVTDEVYQLTWTTEEGKNHSYDEDRVPEGITVPDDVSRRLHNRERITPGYDDTAVYIPRDKRKEWCPVGLVGKVRLRDGCPTNPNWRYMKTVAGKQLWLIR